MKKLWIKNRDAVTTSEQRQTVLDVIEAGFDAINTETVIKNSVSINGDTLTVKGHDFDISNIDNIYLIGFGKVSCQAAAVLEEIFGKSIKQGVAIGLAPIACEYIQTYGGTHPHPSVKNVELSGKILDLSKKVTERDLVIVIVSGGGSALLCWPMQECEQANRLYQDFLTTGGNIKELNTVRKHISQLKGGGLAQKLYPAQIVGLIFSDVPGNSFDFIASGPTYKDTTSIADAQAVLDKYQLEGYVLNETPTDSKYFEKVTNIPMVSNVDALEAMKKKAESLGIKSTILSTELYDSPAEIVDKFMQSIDDNSMLLAGGEPSAIVPKNGGTGGRCERLGIIMLSHLSNKDVFAAVASDGLDNGPAAGVIEDIDTRKRMETLKIDVKQFENNWHSLQFYQKTGKELLETGATGANVSDLIILYRGLEH